MRRLLLVLFVAAACTASARAQIGRGETGLLLTKGSGTAGVLCSRAFSCSYIDTPLARGEKVQIDVRGVRNQPYAVFFGPAVGPFCFKIGAIHNALLFPAVIVPWSGVLSTQDTLRVCPGGKATLGFQVPTGLVPGAQVAIQGLAWSYMTSMQVPTFTVGLRLTVK